MMGHNIRFEGVIWRIIPKLSLLTLLIWSTVMYDKYKTMCKCLLISSLSGLTKNTLDSLGKLRHSHTVSGLV